MRRKVKKKVDLLLSIAIICILLPLFIATISQRMQLEELLYGNMQTLEEENATECGEDSALSETEILPTGTDVAVMEEQLIGIVAKEIGADANEEAILAQCVVARTNLYDAKEKETSEPEALNIEEMRTLWGEQFEECYERFRLCIDKTRGEVLLWNGDYAYAAYHAISAGSTRDISELYHEVEMPYLKAQLCEADVVAEGYLAVFYLEKDSFLEKCNGIVQGSNVQNISDVAVETRDTAGYVTTVKVGDVTCNGEEFREGFGLNSACFSIAEVDDGVRIVSKGLGHGFGLSQHTAEEMAEEGADYKEILAYFFPGTELGQVTDRK